MGFWGPLYYEYNKDPPPPKKKHWQIIQAPVVVMVIVVMLPQSWGFGYDCGYFDDEDEKQKECNDDDIDNPTQCAQAPVWSQLG